jgi:hypothetical protein
MSRAIGVIGSLVVVLTLSSTGHADDKASCVDAYGKAQKLRGANQLVSAREQLRVCAQSTCPKFIARDCATWLVDVESRLPSVVLFAKDSSGGEVSQATVSVDGTVVAQQLDGHAIEVDGGRHVFTFTLPDGKKIDQTYVVLEGQKAQRVGVEIPAAAPPSGGPAGGPAGKAADQVWGAGQPAESNASSWNGRKTLAAVVAGVGVAGIGVGTAFGVTAMSSASNQKSACASSANCTNRAQALTDHSNAANASTLSTIGFIAGGALVATGVVLFFTAPKGQEKADGTSARLQVVPDASPAGAGVLLRGRF